MPTANKPAPEPAATVLRWVRAPQQERTREGLARLLEAAEGLIAEKGYDDASIAEIAERAGSSVGAFYRRFRDKAALFQALHESFNEDARATADDALAPSRWQGSPLARVLREFTDFLVEIYRDREGMLRDLQQRIRDVRQGPDGLLYMLTAEDNGALLRIEPDVRPRLVRVSSEQQPFADAES